MIGHEEVQRMMKGCTRIDLQSLWRKFSPWFLAFSWILGMLLGFFSAHAASSFLTSLMRQSVSYSASILGLLAASIVPFLISALAVSLYEPWLLLIISTLKAFGFSFCACGVSLAFGQSSWLVRFLFLFSDYFTIPLMYLYWLRHIQGNVKPCFWELPSGIGIALTVGWFDYCFVAPFLVSLV
jgi:hypothetical protein